MRSQVACKSVSHPGLVKTAPEERSELSQGWALFANPWYRLILAATRPSGADGLTTGSARHRRYRTCPRTHGIRPEMSFCDGAPPAVKFAKRFFKSAHPCRGGGVRGICFQGFAKGAHPWLCSGRSSGARWWETNPRIRTMRERSRNSCPQADRNALPRQPAFISVNPRPVNRCRFLGH